MMNKNYICWYENESIGLKAKVFDFAIKTPGKFNIISEGNIIREAAFNLDDFKEKLEVYNFMNEVMVFIEALFIEHNNNENVEAVYEDVREFIVAMCMKHPNLSYEIIKE